MSTCIDCGHSLKLGWVDWVYPCSYCSKTFCKACLAKGRPMYLSAVAVAAHAVCNPCYLALTKVDLARMWDVYEVESGLVAPTIVLLPFTTTSRCAMASLATLLQRHHHRVIVPDLAGHGARAGVQVDNQALLDMFDALPLADDEAVVVVGHGFSGHIATWLASRRPKVIRGLVVGGCLVKEPGKTSTSSLILKGSTVLNAQQRITQDRMTIWRGLDEPTMRGVLAGGSFHEAWGDLLLWAKDRDMVGLVARLEIPVLFLLGDEDDNADEALFYEAARQGRRIMLHAGQALPLQTPTAWAEAFREWSQDWFSPTGELLDFKPPQIPVQVSIPTYRIETDKQGNGKDKVVEYEVLLTIGEQRHHVWRRFSLFIQLHDLLSSIARGHPQKIQFPPVPPRHLSWTRDHFEEAFIEERRVGLEQYLMLLLQLDREFWIRDLRWFLTAGGEVPPTESAVGDVPDLKAGQREVRTNEAG